MALNRNKLYLILFIATLAGYIWLLWGLIDSTSNKTVEVCIIKSVTNIPCPSCGSTRSVLHLLHGDFYNAILINPLGVIIAVVMIVMPFWLGYDYFTRKSTLYRSYVKMEEVIRKPFIAIPLILLIIVNWIWNITKGL